MKRPHPVWLAFAACVLVGFGVLGWFTREMLRYERAGDEARRLAAIEENTRLALWRMDSALAGIHGIEAARPWQDYEPFFPADGAFTRELTPLPAGTVMLPSPLLGFTPPFVRLHFEIEPDGTIRSPQAPPGSLRSAALAAGVAVDRLDSGSAALAELRGRIASGELAALRAAAATSLAEQEKKEFSRDEESAARANDAPLAVTPPAEKTTLAADAAATPSENASAQDASAVTEPTAQPQAPLLPSDQQQIAQTIQIDKSYAEQQQRKDLLTAQNEINLSNRARRALPLELRDAAAVSATPPAPSSSGAISSALPRAAQAANAPPAETPRPTEPAPRRSGFAESPRAAEAPAVNDAKTEPGKSESGDEAAARESAAPRFEQSPVAASEGPMEALWVGDELVFARRVAVGGRVLVQGAWLDWSELRAWLLSRVTDLLPSAQLEPAPEEPSPLAVEATRRLAFIPARLVPGSVAVGAASSWSPLQISLSAAWGSAAIGALALALLLHGTLRLSERRGAFVSAVTHELRTPLTTFRMYTEMLAGGMVPDETKRRGYIDTLRKEAERLSHLVENVLSYARLERGRASARVEETTPAELLARIEERLRQRAQQGGLALRIEFLDDAAERPLRTDTTAVEQILFNLVDNAAKYARGAMPSSPEAAAPAPVAGAGSPRPSAQDSRAESAASSVAGADGPGTDASCSRPGPPAPATAGQSVLTISVGRGSKHRAIAIRVSDNGPGIAVSVRRRLFQPFSKSATEAAHSQPGVGLGLALSRRLARDELHGDLALERTGSDGTVFRLELPGA